MTKILSNNYVFLAIRQNYLLLYLSFIFTYTKYVITKKWTEFFRSVFNLFIDELIKAELACLYL